MRIVLIASEATPFAKTGGLADVAGALPRTLRQLGHEAMLFLPFYREVQRKKLAFRKVLENQEMDWQGKKVPYSVWENADASVPAYFIENNEYYDRDYLYSSPKGDFPDNGERFAFFSKACLEALKALNVSPDVLHCHDWQAASTLAFLKFIYGEDQFFRKTRSLFTIHNLAYQGLFAKDILQKVGLPEFLFTMEGLEFYGKVNFLKAGILYSTAVNTVSPRYSQEIQTPEFGHGLDGLLRKRKDALSGILNGVDYSSWNPLNDSFIAAKFGPEDIRGKARCKTDLLRSFKLPAPEKEMPVIGMVSRLAGQKGLDILCEALEGIVKAGAMLVILGTGEQKFQAALQSEMKKHPCSLGLKIAFDDTLAHKIIAGSDLFIVPSRYEPCGLTQIYSLKYGTIPVVRATGGLDDTIQEFDPETGKGNGFKFREYSVQALLRAVKKALSVFGKKNAWQVLQQNALACDFSWEISARHYIELYKKLASL